MKNLRILAAATLFALTSIAMLAGCGDTNSEDGKVCAGQDECASGYVCVEYDKDAKKGKCRVDCASDADKTKADPAKCTDKSQVCTAHGTKFGCSAKAGGGPGQQEPECSATKACQDNTKVCDVAAGKCVKDCTTDNTVCKANLQTCDAQTKLCQDVEFHSVAIVDVTTAAGSCTGTVKDKGSDIVAVAIASSDGTNREYAAAISSRNGAADGSGQATADTHYHLGAPDGTPQDPSADNCIIDKLKGKDGKFSSMGCGGLLSLSVGSSKSFKMGDMVKVYEYDGQQCAQDKQNADPNEDKYKVYICQSDNVPVDHIMASCILISGDEPLSGFSETTIE